MKHILNILFSILILFASFNLYAQDKKGIDFENLDKYLEKSLKEWNIPGMAVAVVQGDSIAFAKGYGVREYGKKDKVDKQTLFAIASNTKSFTSGALSQLVEKGVISWDDKVIKYLPYFELYDPYVTHEMTIRDLLCHRVGLKTFSGDLLWYKTNYSSEEVIRRARFLKPTFGFRAGYGYSNIMFSAAGEIISKVSDRTWQEHVRQEFFNKLNMKNSLISVKELKGKKNVAMPHHSEIGKPHLVIDYMQWDNVAPAAAIISNVEDMSQWLIMQMNEGMYKGKQILNPGQLWEMQAAHTPFGTRPGGEENYRAYGLGWSTFDYLGIKVIGHGGGADGMISRTMYVPELDFGLVVLTNNINYLSSALMYYILEDYMSKPSKDWSSENYNYYKYYHDYEVKRKEKMKKERVMNTKPSLELRDYAGIYGGKLYGDVEVKLKEGKLVLDFLPSSKLIGDLTHWHFNTFIIKLKNTPTLPAGTVNFIMDENGKVIELKVDIPNPDFFFTELEFKKK